MFTTPYVEALMVDPIAVVVVADLWDAGIITRDQAENAWWLIALRKGLFWTHSGGIDTRDNKLRIRAKFHGNCPDREV